MLSIVLILTFHVNLNSNLVAVIVFFFSVALALRKANFASRKTGLKLISPLLYCQSFIQKFGLIPTSCTVKYSKVPSEYSCKGNRKVVSSKNENHVISKFYT